MSQFSVDALKVKYNNTVFYVTIIDSNKLFSISEVSRADEDPESGYQRLLGKARAKKIAEYINNGYVIPGALILSAKEGSIIDFDAQTKKLKLKFEPRSFLVIDGQHRLYGAHESKKNIPIPACIFDKLTTNEEVQYFLDINGTQRGVPRTLQLELTKFTAESESIEELLIKLFDELDIKVQSPLAGKLARTRSVTGKLSHVPFQKALKPLLDKTPLKTLKFDKKVEILINFLGAMEEILLEEFNSSAKITNAAFFEALMQIFRDVCNLALIKHSNYKKSSFRDILHPISELNLEDYSGTNRQAIKDLTSALRDKVSDSQADTNNLF